MNRRLSALCYACYVLGGILFAAVAPEFLGVRPVVAAIASAATALCFIGVHILVQARSRLTQAMATVERQQQELTKLSEALAGLTGADPVDALSGEEAVTEDTGTEAELLEFAARVSERCGRPDRAAPLAATGRLKSVVTEAIADARIDVYLQPIVQLPSRETLHYEALSRVRDAAGDIVMPSEFLPAASAAGVAAALENLQLTRVMEICGRIEGKRPSTRLFCNLSEAALQNADFRSELVQFMGGRRELSRRIIFEMSARAALGLTLEAAADLRLLIALGFGFSVDAAELSQIDALRQIVPGLRYVKVDAGKLIGASKSVISALADSGITIIAARVESERLAAEMIELGVVCGQGFVFGHPKPARQGGGTKQRLAA